MSGASEMKVLALSGGVGGAKLCLGLMDVLPPGALGVLVNTADDFEHLGLHISPDLDTLLYTLSGRSHPTQGWGLEGESWHTMEALEAIGGATWFRLGDKDIATHLLRTGQLRAGASLSAVTAGLADTHQLHTQLWPMSDDPVATVVHSEAGDLSFQDYFVGRQCEPRVTGFSFSGSDVARPHPPAIAALQDPSLQAVVICPSNPFVSIDPILSIAAYREALVQCAAPVIAVSPIVAGQAIKGPTAKMMRELQMPVTALEVARHYGNLLDMFILDDSDAELAPQIREATGVEVGVTNTVMKDRESKQCLAQFVLDQVGRVSCE